MSSDPILDKLDAILKRHIECLYPLILLGGLKGELRTLLAEVAIEYAWEAFDQEKWVGKPEIYQRFGVTQNEAGKA